MLSRLSLLLVLLVLGSCAKSTSGSAGISPTNPPSPPLPPQPPPGPGEVNLNFVGPDHAEDFDKFGGMRGYNIHWGTVSLENSFPDVLCGNILNWNGRPDDKYPHRVDIDPAVENCQANVVKENVPGDPRYGTSTYTHECNVTIRNLPEEQPIFLAMSPHMNVGTDLWWGCPTKEINFILHHVGPPTMIPSSLTPTNLSEPKAPNKVKLI
jgi:hypothetical protein